jgi:hypothetical protein
MKQPPERVHSTPFDIQYLWADSIIRTVCVEDALVTLEFTDYAGCECRAFFYEVDLLRMGFNMNSRTNSWSGLVTNSSMKEQDGRSILHISIEDDEGFISFSFGEGVVEWKEKPRPNFFGL